MRSSTGRLPLLAALAVTSLVMGCATGSSATTRPPDGREELTMILAGSGGYAGFTYYMHAFTSGSAAESATYPFEGIIYEGIIPIPTIGTS